MMSDAEESLKSKTSTEYTVRKVKQIYRKIARMIHPDIFPEAAKNETLSNLWQRTEQAYGENDLKELEELFVLVQKALNGENVPYISMGTDELSQKIIDLQNEIHTIRTTDPYRYQDLLADESAVQDKKKELEDEIKENSDYLQELKVQKSRLLSDCGFSMVWEVDKDGTVQ